MRRNLIRIIAVRELLDQLRDRRTVLMITALPVFLYPVLGMGALQLALLMAERASRVGVVGLENLPPSLGPRTIACAVSGFAPGSGLGVECIGMSAGTVARMAATQHWLEYAPLVRGQHFLPAYFSPEWKILVEPIASPGGPEEELLDPKRFDLVVTIPRQFLADLEAGGRSQLLLDYREADELGSQASNRVRMALERWRNQLRAVRLARNQLPESVDDVLDIRDPDHGKAPQESAADRLMEGLGKIIPFMLVVWALYGALYPAVDLCAGEKERGTMETLLLSPVTREEVVWGKYLVVWLFSAWTSLLNECSLIVSFWQICKQLQLPFSLSPTLLWTIPFIIPLSGILAAICLGLGAYAKSTREAQYYLVPLVVITLPATALALLPSVEVNSPFCLVPITGLTLFLKELTTADAGQLRWGYAFPVLAASVFYNWLALRWAVGQFKREDILFREAERLDLKFWLRGRLRNKEAAPTTGDAIGVFLVIFTLNWMFAPGLGSGIPDANQAFASAAALLIPPLLAACALTRRPWRSLGFQSTPWLACVAAIGLGLTLLLPQAEFGRFLTNQLPAMRETLAKEGGIANLAEELSAQIGLQSVLFFILLPGLASEVAFRGFILRGLSRSLAPFGALLLSSMLYAITASNLVSMASQFIAGLILGTLALRAGSIWPGLLFHIVQSAAMAFSVLLLDLFQSVDVRGIERQNHGVALLSCAIVSLVLIVVLARGIPWRRVEERAD